jgi:hypothetical protein
MKRKTLFVAALLAALATFGVSSAQALSASRAAAIKKAVANVPAAELAAKAASIVASSDSAEREEVAVETLRVIVSKKPSLAPSVVGAIAEIFPESSATVAAEATVLSSEQASEIVKAATSAAPHQATKIASAVAKAAPKSAVKVTRTAVTLVPSAADQIVENVVTTLPSFRQEIQRDATVRRFSRSSSAGQGETQGTISSNPGTIRGIIPENEDGSPLLPTQVTTVTPGSDSDRDNYGRPR